MKKITKPCNTTMCVPIQEKIDDMRDDLITVLESYMHEMETTELFYNAIKFMTVALYECAENHREAFKVLRLAMDDGIKIHVDNKKVQ